MTHPTPRTADPLVVLLLATWLVAEALLPLIAAAVALLLALIGWRPAAPRGTPHPREALAPTRAIPSHRALDVELLPVVELRRLARAAGHRQLARSGRRADLLQALAAA